jgi:hypothetical protein
MIDAADVLQRFPFGVGAQDRDGFMTAFIEVENVKALYAEYGRCANEVELPEPVRDWVPTAAGPSQAKETAPVQLVSNRRGLRL